MDIFSAYATSAEAEEKGRWFENGDVEFCIARSGNRMYSEMMAAQYAAHKHTLDQKDTPEARQAANDRAEKITIYVMSRAVLLGWRGVAKKDAEGKAIEIDGKPVVGVLRDRDGSEMVYGADTAARILALKDFRVWVSNKSDDFRNYLEEVKKADEKNSETTSTGSLPGEVA